MPISKRIVFCGAHGVGKTTLVNALAALPRFRGYTAVTGITRDVLSMKLSFAETQTEVFRRISSAIIRSFDDDVGLLIDRSPLDTMAYSYYFMETDPRVEAEIERAGLTPDDLFTRWLYEFVQPSMAVVDLIVWVRPSFPLVGDDARPDDVEFQRVIDYIFQDQVFEESLIHPAPVVCITGGSVEERVTTICTALDLISRNETKSPKLVYCQES